MAKTGFWLQGAKGKLAGTTIYQQNGETVMREINRSPSNPQTTSQTVQRIIMHTVMQAYSKMKEICDHSFEGIKAGQSTMSYFMKQNVQFAREKIAAQQAQNVDAYDMYNYAPLGMRGFTPNQYQVAMGSLPRIDAKIEDSNLAIPYLDGFSENTYQNIIEKLGLQRGDQLTFLVIRPIKDATEFGQNEFVFARVILDPTNPDGTQAPLSSAFVGENGKINLPSVRNETDRILFSFTAENVLQFKVAKVYGSQAHCEACAVIASRQASNGTWMRSTTYLTYLPNFGIVYSLGDCLYRANKSATPIYATNNRYLNNAGTGNGGESAISGGEASDAPALTSAKVGTTALISGTTASISMSSDADPVQQTVQVTVAHADGKKAAVYNSSTNAKVADATIENGAASITGNLSLNVVYKVVILDGETVINSGYSFKLSYAPAPTPGGGDGGEG